MEGVKNNVRETARAPDVNNMQIVYLVFITVCVLLVLRRLRPEFELFCQICWRKSALTKATSQRGN